MEPEEVYIDGDIDALIRSIEDGTQASQWARELTLAQSMLDEQYATVTQQAAQQAAILARIAAARTECF